MASVLPSKLRRIMRRNRWSYRQLAAAIDVPLATAHGWATGSIEPRVSSLIRLARCLGLDVAELIR